MEERTLMQDICEVVQLANGSHLSDDFWGNATPLLERLGRRLDLTPVQTMLFAVLIELSDDRKIVLKQLAEFLGCRKVELLNHAADFEELIRRQLIRRRRSGSAEPDTYRIPKMVLEALQAGKKFTPPPICGLTIDQFFVRLGKLISYTSQQEMSQTELAEELQQLIDRNQQLEFCCRFREIAQSLHIWDTLVFAQCCNLYVNNRDDHIGWHDIEVLFDDEWAARCEKDALLARYSELFDLNILENAPDSGMFGNREAFRLTDKAKTTLFSEILIQLQAPRNRKELIIASSLTPKKLWFNPGEQAKIDRLGLLLEAERFNAVRQQLWQNGMRQGFACLFYGSPGTGKTESVYQLARQSGRDIMQVDISETKSMWFGESEKRLKEIFDRYRGYVRDCDPAPILLFNEADAVLGRRRTTMGSSLDQTENAMQNILLHRQECHGGEVRRGDEGAGLLGGRRGCRRRGYLRGRGSTGLSGKGPGGKPLPCDIVLPVVADDGAAAVPEGVRQHLHDLHTDGLHGADGEGAASGLQGRLCRAVRGEKARGHAGRAAQ